MGWVAINRQGEYLKEDDGIGRPVEAGNNGELLIVAQEDFGHKVAVDLLDGVVILGYDSLEYQNGSVSIVNPKTILAICEESNIVGEYKHLTQELVDWRDEDGRKVLTEDGRYAKVRNDILTNLTWRPIWFTRVTNGAPAKVIGAQTTTPEMQGGRNIKCFVTLFSDGRIGISG